MTRLTDLKLGQIDLALRDLDREILGTLKQLRYMKTNQVQRLFYPPLVSSGAALTATTRNLNRLKKLGLINHLEKRIGGVRAGSQGLIWFVTEAGNRLLMLGQPDNKRSRTKEPSSLFLRHTLAVTECYVQVVTICRKEEQMELITIEKEPGCWRAYVKGGKQISLRPDLYVEITSGEYKDHWFIEMDLNTESMWDIAEKCKRYHQYRQTEMEQKKNGVFPVVLFIVPTRERKEKIKQEIEETFRGRMVKIFSIITPEELHRVLRDGAGKEELYLV